MIILLLQLVATYSKAKINERRQQTSRGMLSEYLKFEKSVTATCSTGSRERAGTFSMKYEVDEVDLGRKDNAERFKKSIQHRA